MSGIVEEQKISVKDRIAMFSKGSSSTTAPPLQKRHTVTSSQLKSFQPKPAPVPTPARASVFVKPQVPEKKEEPKPEPKPEPPKFQPQKSEPVEKSGGFITHAKTEGSQVFAGVQFGSIKDNPFLKNQKKQQAPAPPPKKPLPSFVTQQKKDAPASVPKAPVEPPKPAVVTPAPKWQPQVTPKHEVVSKPEPQVVPKPSPVVSQAPSMGVERQTSAKEIQVDAISAARKKALAMFGGQKKAEPPKPKWKVPKTASDYKPVEPNIFQKKPEEKVEPKFQPKVEPKFEPPKVEPIIEKKVEFAPEPVEIPPPPPPPQQEVVKPVDPLFAPDPPAEIEKPKPQKQIGKISSPFFDMEKNQGKKKEEELAEKQRKRMEEISALRTEKEVQIIENATNQEQDVEGEALTQHTSLKRDNKDFSDFKAKLAAQFGQRAAFGNKEESEEESEESKEEDDDDDDYDEPAQPANPMMMISAQVESNEAPAQPSGGIFDQLEQVEEAGNSEQNLGHDMLFNKPQARKSKKAAVIFDEDDDQDFA